MERVYLALTERLLCQFLESLLGLSQFSFTSKGTALTIAYTFPTLGNSEGGFTL